MKFRIMTLFLISFSLLAQSNTTQTADGTAVLYTKQIANTEGLAISGTLSLGFSLIGTGVFFLVVDSFKRTVAENNEPTKSAATHAAENPKHVFFGAVMTFFTGNFLVQSFQDFRAAVQNWWGTPKDPKSIKLGNL